MIGIVKNDEERIPEEWGAF